MTFFLSPFNFILSFSKVDMQVFIFLPHDQLTSIGNDLEPSFRSIISKLTCVEIPIIVVWNFFHALIFWMTLVLIRIAVALSIISFVSEKMCFIVSLSMTWALNFCDILSNGFVCRGWNCGHQLWSHSQQYSSNFQGGVTDQEPWNWQVEALWRNPCNSSCV